jgi:hypothetical protein
MCDVIELFSARIGTPPGIDGESVTDEAWHDVQMSVKDRLKGSLAIGTEKIHTLTTEIRSVQSGRHPAGDREHLGSHRVGEIGECRDVRP